MKKILTHWLPPILWMSFIFSLSSRQRIGLSEEYIINFTIFKSLHVIEYAVLYFLFLRAFLTSLSKNKHRAFIYAAVASLMFAMSDEFHQLYVPTREGSFRDIGIDSIGIGLCFMYTENNLEKLKQLL